MIKIKNALFALFALIVAVLLTESLLFALTLASPKVRGMLEPPRKIVELKSGIARPDPSHPDHDKRGFRNETVPETAHIIAMGDSQTYGMGVARASAWPAQLSRLAGVEVYNMAFGTYGPVHSLALLEEGLSLNPGVVIEAFYAGNDLLDSYRMVYTQDLFAEMRNPEEEARRASVRNSPLNEITQSKPQKNVFFLSIGIAIKRHSKIYGVMRALGRVVEHNYLKRGKGGLYWKLSKGFYGNNPERYEIMESGPVKTVFMPGYRLQALNLEKPEVIEGQRAALEAIRRMHEQLSGRGIAFVVLLIPTKELVFAEAGAGGKSARFAELVRNETLHWQISREYLDLWEIPYIDSLPVLSGALKQGNQPYPISSDGHPNVTGHRAIAEGVQRELKTRGWLK